MTLDWNAFWSTMGQFVQFVGVPMPLWLAWVIMIVAVIILIVVFYKILDFATTLVSDFFFPPPSTKHRLGGGALGDVYREYCHSAPRAVKVLKVDDNPEYQGKRTALFHREVELLQKLDGRGTLPKFHHGPHWNKRGGLKGRLYFYMEYIAGDTLRRRVQENGAFARPEDIAPLMVAVSSGLAELHDLDIVHRDINPGNIMLSPTGPRLIDVGIGKQLGTNATKTAAAAGTLPFISPEMVEKAETRTENDVYGWGVTMAYAITQKTVVPEWGADRERSIAIALGHLDSAFVAALEAEAQKSPWHRSLIALIQNCMALSPEERPKDGWDLHLASRALQSVLPAKPEALGHTPDTLDRSLIRFMFLNMAKDLFSPARWTPEHGGSAEERIADALKRLRRIHPASGYLRQGVAASYLHGTFLGDTTTQGRTMREDKRNAYKSPKQWMALLQESGVDVSINRAGLLVFA